MSVAAAGGGSPARFWDSRHSLLRLRLRGELQPLHPISSFLILVSAGVQDQRPRCWKALWRWCGPIAVPRAVPRAQLLGAEVRSLTPEQRLQGTRRLQEERLGSEDRVPRGRGSRAQEKAVTPPSGSELSAEPHLFHPKPVLFTTLGKAAASAPALPPGASDCQGRLKAASPIHPATCGSPSDGAHSRVSPQGPRTPGPSVRQCQPRELAEEAPASRERRCCSS